jgi:hypothetical protein
MATILGAELREAEWHRDVLLADTAIGQVRVAYQGGHPGDADYVAEWAPIGIVSGGVEYGCIAIAYGTTPDECADAATKALRALLAAAVEPITARLSDAANKVEHAADPHLLRARRRAVMATIYEDLASLRAENARLRSALADANERRGKACEALASAQSCHASVKNVLEHRIAELQGERDAALQRNEDLVRMLDIAVRNASEAAQDERDAIIAYAMRSVAACYADSDAGCVKCATLRALCEDIYECEHIESRNPAPAGEEVRDA